MWSFMLKFGVLGIAGAAVGMLAVVLVTAAMHTEQPHREAPRRPGRSDTGNGTRRRRKSRGGGANVQKQAMIDEIRSNEVDCIICLSTIEPEESIFVCKKGCHKIFHLNCTKKWVHIRRNESYNGSWNCPHCFNQYTELPSNLKSLCFCGQTENPRLIPGITPHCCTKMCECREICHPGPCSNI